MLTELKNILTRCVRLMTTVGPTQKGEEFADGVKKMMVLKKCTELLSMNESMSSDHCTEVSITLLPGHYFLQQYSLVSCFV